MFDIYYIASFILCNSLLIIQLNIRTRLTKKIKIGTGLIIILSYLLCFFGDRLYLIPHLILFSVFVIVWTLINHFIKNARMKTILCFAIILITIMIRMPIASLPYPTHLSGGNIDQYILAGKGTFEDPYRIERGNIYSDKFDKIIINTIENSKVIETYQDQIYGGYWINIHPDENKEVNMIDIHYLDTFVYHYWNCVEDSDINPFSFPTYLGENLSLKDRYTIYQIQKQNRDQGLQIMNYIIQYQDAYYTSSLIKEWEYNAGSFIYDCYGEGHYIMGGN